jgi:hypothetical protein
MLFVPPTDPDGQCGLWTRSRLEEMDRCFVAAMEQAFANGGESRAVASATVRVGASLNGKIIESAVGVAYDRLCDKRGQLAAVEVISLVRESCPGLSYARIRLEFDRLFKRRGISW